MTTEISKQASITSQFDNALQSKSFESSLLRGSDVSVLPNGASCMLTYKHNEYGYAAISFLFRVDSNINVREMEAKLEAAHGLVNHRPDLKHEVADVRQSSGIYYRDDKFIVGKSTVSLYTKYCPKESFMAVGVYGHPKEWNPTAVLKIRETLEGLEKAI